jgi:hypothetical protein
MKLSVILILLISFSEICTATYPTVQFRYDCETKLSPENINLKSEFWISTRRSITNITAQGVEVSPFINYWGTHFLNDNVVSSVEGLADLKSESRYYFDDNLLKTQENGGESSGLQILKMIRSSEKNLFNVSADLTSACKKDINYAKTHCGLSTYFIHTLSIRPEQIDVDPLKMPNLLVNIVFQKTSKSTKFKFEGICKLRTSLDPEIK